MSYESRELFPPTQYPDASLPLFGLPTSSEVIQQLRDCAQQASTPEAVEALQQKVRKENALKHRALIQSLIASSVSRREI